MQEPLTGMCAFLFFYANRPKKRAPRHLYEANTVAAQVVQTEEGQH